MIRRELRRSTAACLGVFVLVGAASTRGSAETWRWNYVTRTPNAPPLRAQSTVTVDGGKLSMRYTIPFNKRQIVIEACRATLDEVEGASTIRTQGRTFLLVQLKPLRSASCASGNRPAVALPIDDTPYASGIVAALNRACCGTPARVAVRPSPSPRPLLPQPSRSAADGSPPPAASPSPIGREPAAATVAEAATDGTFVAPKLVKRGSSRLAIGITGTALVRLMISQSGSPQEATIVTISDRRLSAAAIETAVSSSFAPALRNGKPVTAKYVATFTFDGEDPALQSIPMWKRSPLPGASAVATPEPLPAIAPPPTPPAPAASPTAMPTEPPPDPTGSSMPATPLPSAPPERGTRR